MKRAGFFGAACQLLLATAAAAGDEASPLAIDRVSMMQESSRFGFSKAEESYLAAASSGDARSIRQLAHFYMAHGLWVEALARVRDDATHDGRLLAAECELRMGRHRSALARLSTTAPQDAIAAIALTSLGAYDEAREIFLSTPPPESSRNLSEEFRLAEAETFAATKDADKASEALSRAVGVANSSSAAHHFLLGLVKSARDDKAGAAAEFHRAAKSDADKWGMRARLAIAVSSRDVSALQELSLQWRGGAFERDLQFALGGMRLASGDFDRGFSSLRQVIDQFPESRAALEAQDLISTTLPKLFMDETDLHPKEAARLFFENVAFAPPGKEGDVLIQEASEKLKTLGLYSQAAQLLEHQVFNRLRGADRARVAADLADLLLEAKDPKGALKTIRATRVAGLPNEVNNRRRQLESTALAQTGKTEDAIALLSETPGAADLKLRAEINWSRRAWPEAARDYAAYFLSSASRPDRESKSVAVRAATAFLLAGDRAGYRAFSIQASDRLGNSTEADLILSLGDIDRDQFLAKIMDDYRAVFGDSKL